MPRPGKAERIALALRSLGREHGMEGGGQQAVVELEDVAKAVKLGQDEVRKIVEQETNMVWAKLPMGWCVDIETDGQIRLFRRIK